MSSEYLKKTGGHIDRNIVEITIKMKTIVRKLLMIKIPNIVAICSFFLCLTLEQMHEHPVRIELTNTHLFVQLKAPNFLNVFNAVSKRSIGLMISYYVKKVFCSIGRLNIHEMHVTAPLFLISQHIYIYIYIYICQVSQYTWEP